MKYCYILFFFCAVKSTAQTSFKAVVRDAGTKQFIPGVVAKEQNGVGAVSDENGRLIIPNAGKGRQVIVFTYLGYLDDSLVVVLPDTSWHEVILKSDDKALGEVTIVASTRTNERIENAPIKVEVLGKDDMDEENTIKPAGIASIIGDVSGVQIQQASAVSGDANVRIQGLGGQYTQLLRDGMPLFDGFSGGFSVLQIPPLDLKQIELIKGSASTLYGGGAIGGLINLISKRPTENQDAVFTVNQTSLKETDVNAYMSKKYGKWGYTFFTGYAMQKAVDVNNDGFSDVPNLNTFLVHPRLFFYPDSKTSIIVGYTGTFDTRKGGDMQVINNKADSLHSFFEKNVISRNTGELIVERALRGAANLNIKGSISSFNRELQTQTIDFKGNQLNYYTEVSVFAPQKNNSIVFGLNLSGADFRKLPSDTIALSNLDYNTLGLFGQYSLHFTAHTTAEMGLRWDYNNKFGSFILPRVALFHRFNETWATRMGVGFGYKLPDPLVPQVVDYPIESLQPLPSDIKPERSIGYNLEANFKKTLSEKCNLFVNHAFYLTQINDPVIATEAGNGEVFFSNAAKPIVTMGFDTYVRLRIARIELYMGYTYTDAQRKYLSADQFVPLTSRNRGAFTILYEIEGKWRFGMEGSYVGTQYRDGDSNTPSFFTMTMMIEKKFGKKITLVANAENLFDYRQSQHESLYTGSISDPVFKPIWAPIDGRVINLAFRFTPFNK